MPEPSKIAPEKKLLDLVSDAIRTKHYSIRTDRRCLCQLGAAFHPVPRQAPPKANGRAGDRGVPNPSGR